MKKMVVVLLVLVGLIAFAGLAKFRMDAWKHVSDLKQENVTMQGKMDANLREIQATVAALRYCHANPPTTKARQLECEKLDEWAKVNAGAN